MSGVNPQGVVKLLLNLSREEQRRRFLKRIDLPDKNWKFSASDVTERAYWDEYQQALSELLTHASTDWAQGYVIPADHKWFARLAVGATIAHTLTLIDPHYPAATAGAQRALHEAKRELESEAPAGAPADPFEPHSSGTA